MIDQAIAVDYSLLSNVELDRLIHERYGIPWEAHRCRVCGWPLGSEEAAGCTEQSCSRRPRPEVRADAAPDYSTDFKASWSIVATIRARGRAALDSFIEQIDAQADADGFPAFRGLTTDWFFGHCEQPARSICIAALRAFDADERRGLGNEVARYVLEGSNQG